MAMLEAVVESKEVYQLRRLKASINDLKEKGENLTVNKVIRNARLKKVDNSRALGFIRGFLH